MNYVLFFPDEMRAESLACYGHPIVQTPNFDRLAAEGTLFEKNYSQHPVCMASRCALITGWYPHVAGHRTLKYEVRQYEPNFFKDLKKAGFTVGLFGKNHMLTQDAFEESISEHGSVTFGHIGTTQPDGTVINNPDPKSADAASLSALPEPVTDPRQRRLNNMLLEPPISDKEEADVDTTMDVQHIQSGIDFIRRHAHDDNPFFLYLPLANPHPPYSVVEEMYDMYAPEDVPMKDLSWLKNKPSLYETYRQYHEVNDGEYEDFRKINAIYLAMISYTDRLFGQIVDELKAQGVYDDTTIIVCSDHGDWGGDCGLVEKWPNALDDMMIHVPLIIRKPGAPEGLRVTTPTQSIDIFPTVFDIEGMKIDRDQFGVSLLPQVEGAPGDADRVVYSEGGYDVREPHCFEGTPAYKAIMVEGVKYYPKMLQQQNDPQTVCRSVMRRDNRYKLVYRYNGENELYDMQEDPGEYNNLYNDPRYEKLRIKLTDELLRWLIDTSDVVPHEGH